MLNDRLANAMSVIDNAEKIAKQECIITSSKLIIQVLAVLKSKDYIKEFKQRDNKTIKIELQGSINKCGTIKPQFSVKLNAFEKFEKRYLPAKGFGILLITTSKGIMTTTEAQEKNLGGRLLIYCY